ncbi:MAG: isoprenylcysteine carboxylmethyltransferase family protein [Anaerolineae bacterium]|nr:isoprenylcysteine carboxylmethyltransferase family protein [Anaerolineae bacterium]
MSHSMSTPVTPTRVQLDKYGYNCIARHIGMVMMICAPLFIGAGSWDWSWGWLYSSVMLIGWIALSVVLARYNPELLNARGKRAKSMVNTKRWDWIILGIYTVLLLAAPFVAGLDYRYGWSAPPAPAVNVIGLLIQIAGLALLTWAMAVNRFFESTVRIQQNRGHQVMTTGPYRYVRHPGYVAVILQFIAIPLALGTWAALIPAGLGIVLYVIRTALEDRTLMQELPGYTDFAHRTPFRLLPGVW